MKLKKPFSLCEVKNVISGESWICDFEFDAVAIFSILYMEARPGDIWLSFSEIYKIRWMDQAIGPDSDGKFWLKNGKSIRTPLHKFARDRGYMVYFKAEEITFLQPTKLPF